MSPFYTKLFFCLLLVFCSAAQAKNDYHPSLFAPTIFTADAHTELANKEILKLAQDDQGFIWVGTQRGLFRYDGYENRRMTSEGMPFDVTNIYVRSLLADGDDLWIGTMASGLFRLDLRSYQFSHFKREKDNPASLGGNQVNGLQKDSQGNLWIAHSFGLDKFDVSTLTFSHHLSADNPEDRYFNYLLDLETDTNGSLWLATAKGLAKLNPKEQRFSLLQTGDFKRLLKGVVIRRFYTAKDGRIWLATQKQGTYVISGDRQSVLKLETPPSRQAAANTAITETDNGEVWLSGTMGVEIRDAASGRLKKTLRGNLLDKYGLRGDLVYPLLRARSGLVWLGVTNVGLQYYNPQSDKFRHFDKYAPQLKTTFDSYLANVLKVSESELLILNQHTPTLLDLTTGQAKPLLKEPAYNNIQFFSGVKQSEDVYWLGGGNGNVFRFDTTSRMLNEFKLPLAKTDGVFVRHLALSHDGELWIGSDRGLAKLNVHTLAFSRPANSDGTPFINYVRELMVDTQNRVWVGTTSGFGVIDKNRSEVRLYSKENGTEGTLRHNTIVQFLQNRRGEILIYNKSGIDRLLEHKNNIMHLVPFAEQTTADMDNEDVLFQLANGEYRLGAHFLLNENGKPVHTFGEADGVRKSGHGRSIIPVNDSLLHTSINGLVLMAQDAGEPWRYEPPLVVTELSVGNQPLTFDYTRPNIRVPASANQFSLRFAALDYSAPKANRYRYKLLGYDTDWIDTPADVRQAQYTSLPPGEYSLLVEGSNRNGNWSNAPLTLTVSVEAKFFETGWFKALVLLLGAAIIAALFRWRLALAKTKQREAYEKREAIRRAEMMTELMDQKNKMLAEVTHDLRTPLAMVKMQLEALQDGVLQADEKSYETMQKRIAGLNQLVGDIYQLSLMESNVLVLNKQLVNLSELLASAVDSFRPMMQQKNIRLELRDDTSGELKLMLDESRLNQVLNNLMKNSYRYTDEQGHVRITLTQSDGRAVICFEDSHPAISETELEQVFERLYRAKSTRDKSKSGSGLGLWICRSIVEAHGGEITASASPLGGLGITIKLPL